MSRLHNLDDNCFALATELVTALCDEFAEEIGERPSIKELCELLTHGIRGCGSDILSDVNPQSVQRVTPVVTRRSKVQLTFGDILAVPSAHGGYHFVVFITKNSTGWSYGILHGRHRTGRIPKKWTPKPLGVPIYSGMDHVVSGRWRVVGNSTEALELFPRNPEKYYPPDAPLEDVEPGPYGWALAPDGNCRALSKSEGETIARCTGFDTVRLEQQFEQYLDELNA